MCTLHLFYKVFREAPVLLLANRDEHLDRAWEPPGWLARLPRVWGPRDGAAGGTWMGVNEAGLLAGLANHEGTLASGGSLCSRGFVVLESLRHEDAATARAFVEAISPACKAYTLLVADPARAYVVDHEGAGGGQTYELLTGCHVITNGRFRDPDDPKARRCLARMETFAESRELPPWPKMFDFLSDHGNEPGQLTPLCVHPPEAGGEGIDGVWGRFGTSSASVIAVDPHGRVRYHFAPGPPCSTKFSDVTPDFSSR